MSLLSDAEQLQANSLKRLNHMTPTKICYVNGFMICPNAQEVLFILKNRPDFQRGKWNGIGGKIEPGESPIEAMVREFREETGVATTQDSWERTVILEGDDFVVHFYRSFVATFPAYRTVTDEAVGVWSIQDVYQQPHTPCPTLPNMKWILQLQLVTHIKFPLHVQWVRGH